MVWHQKATTMALSPTAGNKQRRPVELESAFQVFENELECYGGGTKYSSMDQYHTAAMDLNSLMRMYRQTSDQVRTSNKAERKELLTRFFREANKESQKNLDYNDVFCSTKPTRISATEKEQARGPVHVHDRTSKSYLYCVCEDGESDHHGINLVL